MLNYLIIIIIIIIYINNNYRAIVIAKAIDKYIFDKVYEQIKNKNAKVKKTRIISLKVIEHQHFIRRNKDYHVIFLFLIYIY